MSIKRFLESVTCSLCFLSMTTAALGQAQAELSLPIDPSLADQGWKFDPQCVQVVQKEQGKPPALGMVYVKGKPAQLQFTSKQDITLPAVFEADVLLPTVDSTVDKSKGWVRDRASFGMLQPSTQPAAAAAEVAPAAQPKPAAAAPTKAATGPAGKAPASSTGSKPATKPAAAPGAKAPPPPPPPTYMVTVSRGRFLDGYSYQAGSVIDGKGGEAPFKPQYSLGSISPLMDENVRLILERRADQLPAACNRVYHLRMEARADSVTMYVNGRLVGQQKVSLQPGKALLTLDSSAQLLSARVRPMEDAAKSNDTFVTVPLDDYCNAKSPAPVAALPAEAGRVAPIEGIPFIKSAQGSFDNLALAPSIYMTRMGDMRANDPRHCVLTPETMDITRFTLRVPGRTYARAWVLAASDSEPNSVPVMTLRFYKPETAWLVDATVNVPNYTATSSPGKAKRVALKTADGKAASLWLIPIDLDAAALAAEPMSCIELTKAIYPYRGYPDPAYYNDLPGGLPSSVHVYGLTLEEAPLWARGTSTTGDGNMYVDPETPKWRVLMRNLTSKPLDVNVNLTVTDPYGKASELKQQVKLAADGEQHEITFEPSAKLLGLYTVQTAVQAGDFHQSRSGTFLHLPKNTRKATSDDSPWGLWCWYGGHQTQPSAEDNIRLLKNMGAINNYAFTGPAAPKQTPANLYEFRKENGVGVEHYRLVARELPAWSRKVPYDPAEYAKFSEEKGKEAAEQLRLHPDLKYVNLFAENAVSLRLTHGMSPWAMGQSWFEYTKAEADSIPAYWATAKAAAEGVRKYAPSLKIIFGHCAANFEQPFFRLDDWDKNSHLFDGFGMDLPQFERMPERQPRATEPSLLWFLHHEMKDKGLVGKEIVHLESYFPPTGPMAMGDDEQADSVVRTAILSLSLGTTRFERTWGDHVCADGWGNSHYGSCGLIDRAPEYNPKPSAEAFATMTQVLDTAKYDGYIETGSRSAFCVRFKDADRLVYAVWTIRGTRPIDLTIDGSATRYDAHGNAFPVPQQATVTLTSSPEWIVVRNGSIKSAAVGKPAYTEAPAKFHKVVEDFETADWKAIPGKYERYETNHWDMPREAVEMQAQRVDSSDRKGKVFRVQLTSPDPKKPMVGFYSIFEPQKPIEIAGKAKALGLWVNGHSAWNRIIYQFVDAKGETWINIGMKDQWNCDDTHSWSSINHDGWRYMSFPLPGNAPGDNFREADTTWWGFDAGGDGIVDLPIKLTRIMVEMRPQMIYVNDMLPNDDLSIEMDDLTVEYADAASMTDEPVKTQQAAAGILNKGQLAPLPNPYADLQKTAMAQPPAIDTLYPPVDFYNGTRLIVEIKPVEGAKQYKGYVSAHPDGTGAQALAVDKNSKARNAWLLKDKADNTLLFDGLRPATPMYIFVTFIDADGKESKPSPIREVLLRDEFPFK